MPTVNVTNPPTRHQRTWRSTTAPGDEAQFDFCDLSSWAVRFGWNMPLVAFGMILSWSRFRVWWFTTSEDRHHTFEGAVRFFDQVGGVPAVCRTDRMGALGRSQGRRFELHPPTVGFAAHHGTKITSCQAGRRQTQGARSSGHSASSRRRSCPRSKPTVSRSTSPTSTGAPRCGSQNECTGSSRERQARHRRHGWQPSVTSSHCCCASLRHRLCGGALRTTRVRSSRSTRTVTRFRQKRWATKSRSADLSTPTPSRSAWPAD
ncbi:MAG: DDE-type integrase/transposase/recombinase [Candidatus Microthrix sp.]|nr:DDE-type integrase/transposase/recombinase [Candidatus Microthrix sp.]